MATSTHSNAAWTDRHPEESYNKWEPKSAKEAICYDMAAYVPLGGALATIGACVLEDD